MEDFQQNLRHREQENEKFLSKLFVYLKTNFIHSKIHNPQDITKPIVKAIKDKKFETVEPDDISSPIVDAISSVKQEIAQKQYPDTFSMLEAQEIKQGLSEITVTLREEIQKLDKEVVVKNNFSELFGLFKKSSDKKDLLKALKRIEKKIPSITLPEIPDYTAQLQDISSRISFDISPIVEKLQDIVDKQTDTTLELPDEFIEKKGKEKRIKVAVDKWGGGMAWDGQISNKKGDRINPATEDTATNILAKLQEVADNTDELEIKADQINLNTDELENKLDTLQNDKALASKQLPNNHDVTVSNQISGYATSTKQDEIITELQKKANNDEIQPVEDAPLSTINTTTVTLTDADTAYKLPPTEQTDRRVIILYNGSDADMYYGDSSVTTDSGILLASGAEVSLDISANLYVVCGEDGKIIRVMEMK